MYSSKLLSPESAISDKALARFCYRWYFRTLIENPIGIAGKVASQMGYFFSDFDLFCTKQVPLKTEYEQSISSLPTPEIFVAGCCATWGNYQFGDVGSSLSYPRPSRQIGAIYSEYYRSLKTATQVSKTIRANALAFVALRVFGFLCILADGLFLILLIACLVRPALASFRLAGLAALMIYLVPFGNALTVSIVHTLEIHRYRFTYGGFLLLAQITL